MTISLDGWLEDRRLDPELASKMGWEWVKHAQLGPSVMIPYYRDGKAVTRQFRALAKKEFRFDQGSEVELWNVDCLKDRSLDTQPLILAEGACDGLAIMQCGFPRVVAIPGWSDKKVDGAAYEPFERSEELIKKAGKIIVAQHADDAGAAVVRAVATFFHDCEVRHATWPAGCKDANDTLVNFGPQALVMALNEARQVDPPGGMITGFSDMPIAPERRVFRLDFPNIDKRMAFRTKAISVLTGKPGDGKTTFVTWAAYHAIRASSGLRVGMMLFETTPEETLMQLARLKKGPHLEDVSPEQWKQIKLELDERFRLVHRVDDNKTSHDLAWLKTMVHRLAVRDHCKLIFIDPWNELEHLPEKGESMTSYINFALTKLRQWAEKYDCHICIVAHPRKLMADEMPTGYHVSDSAAWVNKPDMGWTLAVVPEQQEKKNADGKVTREAMPEHVALLTWKVRSRQQTGCCPGVVRLTFDDFTMAYRELRV